MRRCLRRRRIDKKARWLIANAEVAYETGDISFEKAWDGAAVATRWFLQRAA